MNWSISTTNYIKYDNQRNILFDIDELDPWQEMIMKNHLESKRAKEKSLENPLSNYLYWVPESDSDLESEWMKINNKKVLQLFSW